MATAGKVIYQCVVSEMEGKKRKLKDVGDGYVEMMVGVFGVPINGYHWAFTRGVQQLFAPGSELQSNVSRGQLFGEAGHPDFNEYLMMSKGDVKLAERMFMQRLLRIDEAKISTNFRKLSLTNLTGERGNKYVGVVAELKPMTEVEEARIHTPDINAAYSVRAFSECSNGGAVRTATGIATYDSVVVGGSDDASKFLTPSLQGKILTPNMLVPAEAGSQVSLQCGKPLIDVVRIKDSMGWREIPIGNPNAMKQSAVNRM